MKTRKEVLDYGLSFSDTYQNKEHWNTVILDGTVPADEIKRMIADSYDLVLTKKER